MSAGPNRIAAIFFAAACVLAATRPQFETSRDASPTQEAFAGWPSHWGETTLQPLALSEREIRWQADFPGRLARFQIGTGPDELIMRWVRSPSRQVHPARHCFRGSGYSIEVLPAWRDDRGRAWNRFHARHPDGRATEVRELVLAAEGTGHWPDIGSWYWASAVQRSSTGPWWVLTHTRPL